MSDPAMAEALRTPRLSQKGSRFLEPVRISKGSVGWLEPEVNQRLEVRKAAR